MAIKGFKGFNKDLQCRDKQYEIGAKYEEKRASICEAGMHFCENALDVFGYYPPGADNRYTEVEGDGKTERHTDDSKVCCSNLKIGAEINMRGMIEAGIKFIFEKTQASPDTTATTGDGANAATTGDGANAEVKSKDAVAAAVGIGSNARGALGSWLVLAEWERDSECKWHIKDVKAAQVDGEKIKADTFYQLKGGEFVETGAN